MFVTMKVQIILFISFLLLSIAADHLFFLILRLQQLSRLFHCPFSTCCTFSADGYFSWLYCQYIIAFSIFTIVPLRSMGKCFKKLQFGCCIFWGPNDFLVHENHEKAKMHSVSVQTDMSNERYIYKYGRKYISVSWELYLPAVVPLQPWISKEVQHYL